MKRNTSGLKKGNPGHKGAGGRPPDWLKKKCQNIVDKKKLIERLGQIAAGEPLDLVIDSFGKPVKGPDGKLIYQSAPFSAQVKAAQELLDRGFGKPSQLLGSDPENPLPSGIVVLPAQDIGERGKVEKR